jgi:hypothetical protein
MPIMLRIKKLLTGGFSMNIRVLDEPDAGAYQELRLSALKINYRSTTP